MAISAEILTKIEVTVKLAITNCQAPNLKSIESQLSKLSEAVETSSKNEPLITQPPSSNNIRIATEELIESTPHVSSVTPTCTPYAIYKENFITEEYASEIQDFLDSENFHTEGKRQVVSYGEKYKYMGSNNIQPKQIPDILKPMLESLHKDLGYSLNQILVNKFSGGEACLPSHSDDERDINPSSNIFTVSLGDSANVLFSCFGNEEKELTVKHCSLYSMTKESQNVFKHGILPNPNNSNRYSITFRCVHWKYLNSTYAVGDSNFGKIKFGEGKGYVGKSTPGLKDFAPTVESIEPSKCLSYCNVVIMCGTNNLKKSNVDVLETYKTYKGKFVEIRKLNPKCNLFVCPVLPSRSRDINAKIVQFNKLLFSDLVQSNLKVNIVHGFGAFVDKVGILKDALHDKRTTEDVLHINETGYKILVKCIKTAIFDVKKTKSKFTTGRLYSNVTRGGPPNPV